MFFITGNPRRNCKVTAAASNGRGTAKVVKIRKHLQLKIRWKNTYKFWAK